MRCYLCGPIRVTIRTEADFNEDDEELKKLLSLLEN